MTGSVGRKGWNEPQGTYVCPQLVTKGLPLQTPDVELAIEVVEVLKGISRRGEARDNPFGPLRVILLPFRH